MSKKKIFLFLTLAILLIAGVWGYKLFFGKPFNINHFFDRAVIETALAEPELLSMAGVIDNTLIDFHSDKLTDASPAQTTVRIDAAKQQFATLNKYDRSKLTGQKALSYDVAEWFMEVIIEGERWAFHDFPVNATFGVQSQLPSFMDSYHSVTDVKSAENYIARLRAFKEKFDGVRESVLARVDLGVVPPAFVVEQVLTDMRSFINHDPAEHSLVETLIDKLSEVESISPEKKYELEEQAALAVKENVYPAYERLIKTFEDLEGIAGEDAGAWTLPDGDEYYAYLIRFHTTLPLSADDVHQNGLQEVERIKNEMFGLFKSIGIADGNVAERFRELDERPGMFYEDTEESFTLILNDYSAYIDTLYEWSEPYFNKKPDVGIRVRRVPEHAEENAPFAYYDIPSFDGERPGTFYANLRAIDKIPKYGMKTLAAHEGVPGHHFQIALQMQLEGVPTMRNILPFTAYIEGWALYTEWLMEESGFYENDPYSNLGRLQGEMFRAARLVVDTGIHSKRWTRQEAVNYLNEQTGFPMKDIVSEVDRYVVMPGQALSYKIGMNHIIELRKKAENELGSRFDIREFHDVILMNGSLPLEILTEVVEGFIADKMGI